MRGDRLKKSVSCVLCAVILMFPAYAGWSSAGVQSGASNTGYASYILTVNGVVINTDSIKGMPSLYIRNNNIMVPVRVVAEALGCSVSWNSSNRCIGVGDDSSEMLMFMGEDEYSRSSKNAVNMTVPVSLGTAPELIDGYAFVPARAFELLYCKVAERANTVTIYSLLNSGGENAVNLPNPVTEHATLSEAGETLGFQIKTPGALDEESMESICSVFGILDVDYSGGIGYRMSLGDNQDISGDYTEYETVRAVNVAGYSVTIRGSSEKIMAAVFSDGIYSYALSFSEGIEFDGLISIILSI